MTHRFHRGSLRVLAGAATAALALTLTPQAPASPPAADGAPPAKDVATAGSRDDRSHPLGDQQRERRKAAAEALATGTAKFVGTGRNRTIDLGNSAANKGKNKYVWYPTDREESIFTILSEFGDQTKYGGDAGPLHNQIPAPDRTTNNSTYWLSDFSKTHYQQMMFGSGESFKDFYLKQSNGRFLAKGDVSDWVKVPYNEARYGNNDHETEGYWAYVTDTVTAWYNAQKAAGKSDAEITAYLKQFDQVDRYDYDGDGNYNEPDGYIDHFQAIHAGEGEEAGGGAQGDDAIWSHRWYVNADKVGVTGPAANPAGGAQIGNTGIWVGDYTTEPENGGLGVFTHEFGHDLGLADYYDTAGGDNGTGFWTLMSAGSWLSKAGANDIGTSPGYLGPHEKLLLGWLDYKRAPYRVDDNYWIGPADRDGKNRPQALLVNLPDKSVTTTYNTPHSASNEWWSGAANDLRSSLTRTVDLTGKSSASLGAWLWNDTEEGYDWLFVEASGDGGATWTVLEQISGRSREWVQKSWDLSAFAGKSVQVRFRNTNDGGLNYAGSFLDDISVSANGATVFSDNVENGDNGWTAVVYSRINGSVTTKATQYYLAENRVYAGYDANLKSGPYNFGWGTTKPNWVEKFPYQNGLLVWYVDNTQKDNNTSAHPGSGWALPVDARPTPIVFPDGRLLGNRRQVFDATFGQEATDPVTFHRNGVAVSVPAQPAIPTFDDSNPNRYWSAANKMNSVKVAGTGTSITVHQTKGDELLLKVRFTK